MSHPRGGALVRIALAELLAMSVWFSASAVAPTLATRWALGGGQVAMLAMSVQAGFVVGALLIAGTGMARKLRPKWLFVTSGSVALVANLVLIWLGPQLWGLVVVSRLLTGVGLAGVYPSGLAALSGWFQNARGTALGVLVGALVVGSALPHLVAGLPIGWQGVVASSSGLAALGVALMAGLSPGPDVVAPGRFSSAEMRQLLDNRRFRLSTVGYLGHMWELYAMWAWVGAFLAASQVASSDSAVAGWTFAAIAVGAVGAAVAGLGSDRVGRSKTAGIALALSGLAALATPAVYGGSPGVVGAVILIWGFAIVADSAQFSVMATESVRPEARTTALALQTAAGFLLAMLPIWMVPFLADRVGWRWAFLVLVPGPIVGLVSTVRYAKASPSVEPARR